MEVALSLWIEDRNQKRVPLSGPMVREKAKRLYAHFKEPDGSCSGKCTDGGFQASRDTAADTNLSKFLMQTKLHCFGRECQTKHSFLKAKDRVTLVLCSNASGDCVIKPLMLYRSFNPRALQNQNKDNPAVFWRANKKA
ncbi:tigger transposable element-derived protein 1-like [Glossina fuscipes]|uniref:Tigger transposable element-derived protein 1-like n=1 Tax=Glossina fuscipes TaxID=7396 RepID=A0A9C5ZP35_9MUSC|nr:tigger transposable element-derived protein 1-like [Glossina fuscipes]